MFIQRAEGLGEPAEDPLALFSILYGVWVWNFAAFNGRATLDLARQFLTLALEQNETLPLAIGHRTTAAPSLWLGTSAKPGNTSIARARFTTPINIVRWWPELVMTSE